MDNVVTIVSLVVAVVAAAWGIYQTYVSDRLQQRFHRLSLQLSQSIQRLERARELVIAISTACEQMGHTAYIERNYVDNPNIDTPLFASKMTEAKISEIELLALSKVIGDEELHAVAQELSDRIFESIDSSSNNGNDDATFNWLNRIEAPIEKLHVRIYQLLEEATRE